MGGSGARGSDRSTHRALQDLLTDRPGPFDVRPHVLDSWRRSQAAGVDPDGVTLPPLRYEDDDLEAYRQQHSLSQGMSTLRQLTRELIDGGEQLVAVTDASGVLLWVEGTLAVRNQASAMNFVPGAAWDEDHAGTNAPAVALRTRRDVEILASEHYSRVVQPWSCVAAVVRNPETTDIEGVLDLTWPKSISWPYALSVVRSVAGALEGDLLTRSMARRRQAEQRYVERAMPARGKTALVGPDRRIALAPGSRALIGSRVDLGTDAGTARLADGRVAEVEPLGFDGYVMLRLPDGQSGTRRRMAHPVPLRALGLDEAILDLPGRSVRLRPRFAEIVVLLALHPEGMSSEKLGMLLLGDESNPVTVRAEMSRLRRHLGEHVLKSRPYRLEIDLAADFFAVRSALRDGRLRAALKEYRGPLLPASEAPGIREERANLHLQLRAAVLSTRDPGLLRKWVESAWGSEDGEAWEVLAAELPSTSNASASAAAQAAALQGVVPVP
jgi:hypothetical protein